jgi:protein MpaA
VTIGVRHDAGVNLTAFFVAAIAAWTPAPAASPGPASVASYARVVYGHSVRGRSLVAVHAGARSSARKVLVVGSIHGNERAGQAVADRLARAGASAGAEVWVIRESNPDGAAANTRQNAHGVDLNRNFPYGFRRSGSPFSTYYSGPRPLSEPESRSLAAFIRKLKPDVTIYYHQHLDVVALPPGHGAAARAARRYARLAGMRAVDIGAKTGSAAGWQRNTLREPASLVVELPAGSLSAAGVRRQANAVLAFARG